MMKPIFERRNRSGMPPVYAMGHYGRRGVAAQADSSRRRRACRYGYEKRSHECESGTRERALRGHYLATIFGASWSTRRSDGKSHDHSKTIAMVPNPPSTTAGTVPNHCAVMPDSNWPSSLEAPMKIQLTALTRPRMSS